MTFQLWNLIKLTSKEEELDALPGHSWHGGWLAHRFVKMGQSAKTSTFLRRGLVYFRLRQLFCSTLACTALISGEFTSVSVRAAYNERCCVHGNAAVMNMKQFYFPSCKSWTLTDKKQNFSQHYWCQARCVLQSNVTSVEDTRQSFQMCEMNAASCCQR